MAIMGGYPAHVLYLKDQSAPLPLVQTQKATVLYSLPFPVMM